ncbi:MULTISPECIES: endonuclease/exonuclease/phosphatase family protein [Streptomyces]|uniref:endonuclease/exonuclease/phosphatase family protein n=1 Tax=Streptomyces TaxID=1883 RepID=UPI0019D1E992|nr:MULTISPECIES: endonuclease/exonuclease/phosphatase family protein [Streptomyces]
MRQFRRAWLATAGALLAVLLPTATAQADTAQSQASSAGTYNVWQWNVAGNTFHRGSSDTNMVSLAATSMVNRDADFAAFNELCRGQYDALVEQLRAKNWPVDETNFARFEPSRAANTGVCGEDEDEFGNAIFSKRPLGTAARIDLADDGSLYERRNLLCAPLADGSGVRFCATHLTTVDSVKYTQINEIKNRLEGWHGAGEKVLIAGDFNVQPHYPSMNPVYSASVDTQYNDNNVGAYRELDDNDPGNCWGYGEPTTNAGATNSPCGGAQKLDLILVRESALASPGSYSADSLVTSENCTVGLCSDHRILTGTVTLK